MTKPIIFTGPPAAGKSTLGRAVAAALGRPFVDLDDALTAETGLPPAAFFATHGEPAFRAAEGALLRRLVADPAVVVAAGGGALLAKGLRHALAEEALLVRLDAPREVLLARAAAGPARPLLGAADDGRGARMDALLDARAAGYAESHLRFETGTFDGDVDALAAQLLALDARDPILVPAGARSYLVDVTHSDPAAATDRLAERGPSRLVVVTDSHVARAQKKYLAHILAPLTAPSTVVTLAPGEANKTLPSVAAIWDAALGAGVDRGALVVAFGGGVVGDLAGFAAATLLRGVEVAQLPTSLLAMVDSSVGGKTGFDHGGGKNLVGAFHPPSAVVADTALLATLPPRELRAGLAEAVKIALTSDAALFEALEALAGRGVTPEALAPIVRRAVTDKMRVVREDPEERGLRAILNFGHTFGHALEAHGGFTRWLHGEAVALGCLVELESGVRAGHTPEALLVRAEALVGKLGLPTRAALPAADRDGCLRHLGHDKKRRGGRVTLPRVTGLGQSHLEAVPLGALRFESA